mmetsp:Transcript_4132/g.9365  ORF Transcript_4132/g.9365 Transcript_4132/m.9365 type:complete len:227 (-) Transcript_4132:44-724(-)
MSVATAANTAIRAPSCCAWDFDSNAQARRWGGGASARRPTPATSPASIATPAPTSTALAPLSAALATTAAPPAAATAAPTAARWRLSLRDGERTAVELVAVERFHCRLAVLFLLEVDKPKAARSPILVDEDVHADDVAERLEELLELLLARAERQIANIGAEPSDHLCRQACLEPRFHRCRIVDQLHGTRQRGEACGGLVPCMPTIGTFDSPPLADVALADLVARL